MKLITSILLSLMFYGCSITTKVPSVQSYRLSAPKVSEVTSDVCKNLTLEISAPQANNLFYSFDMHYIEDNIKEGSFTRSRYSVPPAESVFSILNETLSDIDMFKGIVSYNTKARSDLILYTTIIDFMQYYNENNSSYSKVSMNFVVLDSKTKAVKNTIKKTITVKFEKNDALDGFIALNKANHKVILELVPWLETSCK